MHKLVKIRIGLYLLVLIVTMYSSAEAQTIVKTVDSETYEKAIDIVLPMELSNQSYDYAYLIRIKPSLGAESLTVILVDGKSVITTRHTSADGNLFYYFSSLLEKEGIESPEGLAKRVELRKSRRQFMLKDFRRVVDSFSKYVVQILPNRNKPSATTDSDGESSTSVIIDGTNYEVKYITSQRDSLYYTIYDYSIEAKEFESPITGWIKTALAFIDSQETKQ